MNLPSLFAILAVAAPAATADVIFNNFGPGNTFLGNAGWSVANGGPFGAHIEESVSFTPTGNSYFFDSAEIAIGHLFGPNLLFARLHADAGGAGSPGAILESIQVVGQMLPLPTEPTTNNPPVVLPFSGTVLLQEGMRYWLSVSTDPTTDSWAAWNENITGDVGQRAFRENGGAWQVHTGHPRGAFRLNATPIPAPACALLLAAPLALRRRR